MIFLKRIEAFGFKSFADRLTIEFNASVIGVVGPNGSGKSNINDAVRWVLGEQSVKSLRGEKAEDIIFNGAIGKKPLNMAEVTLVFDNSTQIFNSPYDEIQITRKIYRNSSENEYYINKERVRLKDVQNLVFDTGLSKGSLAIISQGNISHFADAKPEERRLLFEEAAGVAKYKKRKEDSLRKLERTNDNLIRVDDIVSEISRKIEPLAKQAEKAKKYISIRDNLKKYEITLLAKDGTEFQLQLGTLNNNIIKNSKDHDNLTFKISNYEQQLKSLKNQTYDLDKQINSQEMNLSNINTLLSVLEQQKEAIINKNNNLQNNQQSQNQEQKLEQKINEIINFINQKKIIKQEEEKKLAQIVLKLKDLQLMHTDLVASHTNLLTTLGQKKATLSYLIQNQERKNFKHQGVQTILNNRNNLYGIVDIIANVIEIEPLYETAMAVILGNNLRNIITLTDKDAARAVKFLKDNKAGIATFLPLNTIQVRVASREEELIVNGQNGYIGFAHNLVTTLEPKLKPAINYLLGRTIICEDLEAARKISQLIAAKFQCVSLDGQIIKAGGSIVGGYQNQNNNLELLKKDNTKEQITSEIKSSEQELITINLQINNSNSEITNQNNLKTKVDIAVNRLQAELNNLENQSQILSTEYQSVTGKKIILDNNQQLNDIFAQYETSKYQQEEINSQLQTNRKQKHELIEQMQKLENELFLINQEAYTITNTLNQDKVELIKLENKVEQILKRLVEGYHLTLDHAKELYNEPLTNENEARELVATLRSELEDLGYVNIDAIEEYENENERYLRLKAKHDELTAAIADLMKAIDEMDHVMITKFDETITNINKVLPETFVTLFGGGNCQLKYNDPDNLLETGIEVIANPPGKKISNLNLLSGGEKSLVALAVLFAILKVKPLPLTILDEVEAPLDPANLERFARYVRNFSETTQFIIVTHRPGTMENCDVLYGITMENQGITKVVNIKLADAKSIIKNEQEQKNPSDLLN